MYQMKNDRQIPFKISILKDLFAPVECEGSVSESAVEESLEPNEWAIKAIKNLLWSAFKKAYEFDTGLKPGAKEE